MRSTPRRLRAHLGTGPQWPFGTALDSPMSIGCFAVLRFGACDICRGYVRALYRYLVVNRDKFLNYAYTSYLFDMPVRGYWFDRACWSLRCKGADDS